MAEPESRSDDSFRASSLFRAQMRRTESRQLEERAVCAEEEAEARSARCLASRRLMGGSHDSTHDSARARFFMTFDFY